MTKVALLAALLALLLPSTASAYVFTLEPGVPNTTNIRRALSYQTNLQVSKFYPVDPVSFGPHGIPVYAVSKDALMTRYWALGGTLDDVSGFHTPTGIWIWRDGIVADETDWESHEIMEQSTDPTGMGQEIADPVVGDTYRMWGTDLSSFVLPSGGSFR